MIDGDGVFDVGSADIWPFLRPCGQSRGTETSFYSAYTAIHVGYDAIAPELTSDDDARNSLNLWAGC